MSFFKKRPLTIHGAQTDRQTENANMWKNVALMRK